MSEQPIPATQLLGTYLDKLTIRLDEMADRLRERQASGVAITVEETSQMVSWFSGIACSVRLTRETLGLVVPIDPDLPPNVVRLPHRRPATRIVPITGPDGAA